MKEQVEQVLGPIGARAWVHAVDLDSGAEAGYGEYGLVALASVFKIPVLVELFRRFGDGRLSPDARLDVPAEGRSAGPTGLSVMADPIELSLRDLAYWMMSVSDNAATDILVNLLGIDAINATLRELGLTRTRVDGTCDDLYQTMYQDVPEGAGPDALRAARAVDPERTQHSGTPREVTRLLTAIWKDEAAGAAECAEMRRILGLQAWPHRLRAGFTEPGTRVSAKTGTLPFWRNEAGVVEADGGRFAVAVFIRTEDHRYRQPAADACVGTLGRLAVDHLRSSGGDHPRSPGDHLRSPGGDHPRSPGDHLRSPGGDHSRSSGDHLRPSGDQPRSSGEHPLSDAHSRSPGECLCSDVDGRAFAGHPHACGDHPRSDASERSDAPERSEDAPERSDTLVWSADAPVRSADDRLRSRGSGVRRPGAVRAATPEEIREHAAGLGAEIWLHARDLDTGKSVGVGENTPVVTASVFKVPVALELARQAAAGEIDLTQRVTVPDEGRVPSPYGLAAHRDHVVASYRDLAQLMMVISDNVATDLVLDRVGKDRVAALLAELGLGGTAVPQNCAEILASVAQDLGTAYGDDERELSEVPLERLRSLRALDPARTCRTTPEEITRLLAGIWREEAAVPDACALVRGWMGAQIWPHRLSSGFPGDDVVISGKTGTLPLIRNEAGVLEFRDGGRYAVGVFTRAADPTPNAPHLDALIGWAAAEAVAQVRGERH
ncbi:serine hydrolase [Nonomuraea sp. NPDC050547]|uniref:serine hydrolase n=1 Tax=Nonomuraea sp. NPDC050547 TaxID=3364368 RepID=UPI0037881515